MLQVWLLFKGIESIIGTICMCAHAAGFLGKEPIPHILLFCGTFCGFTLISFTSAIGIAIGNAPAPLIECVINFCGAVMYFMSSIVSMYYAETDFHLMYLTDFEEPLHPFFDLCRTQSICALIAGAVHLLHALLSFDALLISKSDSQQLEEFESDSDGSVNYDVKRPLRLYFLGKDIEMRLRRKNKWFDNLCQRHNTVLAIHSDVRKYRSSSEVNPKKKTESSREMAVAASVSVVDFQYETKNKVRKDKVNDFKQTRKSKYLSTDTDESSERLEKPIVQYYTENVPNQASQPRLPSFRKDEIKSMLGQLDIAQRAERPEKSDSRKLILSASSRTKPEIAKDQHSLKDSNEVVDPERSEATNSHYLSALHSAATVGFEEPPIMNRPTPAPSIFGTLIPDSKEIVKSNSLPTPEEIVNESKSEMREKPDEPDTPSVQPVSSEIETIPTNSKDVEEDPQKNEEEVETESMSGKKKEGEDKKPKPESDPPN